MSIKVPHILNYHSVDINYYVPVNRKNIAKNPNNVTEIFVCSGLFFGRDLFTFAYIFPIPNKVILLWLHNTACCEILNSLWIKDTAILGNNSIIEPLFNYSEHISFVFSISFAYFWRMPSYHWKTDSLKCWPLRLDYRHQSMKVISHESNLVSHKTNYMRITQLQSTTESFPEHPCHGLAVLSQNLLNFRS